MGTASLLDGNGSTWIVVGSACGGVGGSGDGNPVASVISHRGRGEAAGNCNDWVDAKPGRVAADGRAADAFGARGGQRTALLGVYSYASDGARRRRAGRDGSSSDCWVD